MIYEIYTENGTKKKRALTGDGYGLPLGTWISYEGTCPDGFIESEQTFNTTTYASLYAMLGTNKVPARFDHSKLSDYEDITISSDSNNPTVMDYDGFYTLSIGSSGAGPSLKVYVNGVQIGGFGTGGQYTSIIGQITIPFKKGDSIYKVNSSTTIVIEKVAYYKRHLAIKATPAYVEPDTVSDMVHTMRVQDSYSTEEVNTGKKWIDGKPIYRKCWTNLSANISSSTWVSTGVSCPANLETIVTSEILGRDSDSAHNGNVIKFAGVVGRNKNTNIFDVICNGYIVTVQTIILEYTKTTD